LRSWSRAPRRSDLSLDSRPTFTCDELNPARAPKPVFWARISPRFSSGVPNGQISQPGSMCSSHENWGGAGPRGARRALGRREARATGRGSSIAAPGDAEGSWTPPFWPNVRGENLRHGPAAPRGPQVARSSRSRLTTVAETPSSARSHAAIRPKVLWANIWPSSEVRRASSAGSRCCGADADGRGSA
jgi:hypothetical protein